ncbi:hypothetical protein [Achromobacter sp.]|uniref:hypothetical protein n=1 Tax=Achromobacter sp. TaxID=134375 RepID=UPI0028B09B29|nr:hypothetical protein [Achromobacter sp.]
MKLLIATLLLAIPILAAANDMPDAPFRTPPDERFVVSTSPYFHQPERAIANRLEYLGKSEQTNHFCLVGYRWKGGAETAWLHWKEEESLIPWYGNRDKRIRESSLMDDSDAVKWGRDTFEEGELVEVFRHNLSTRAWKQLAADCERYGKKYVFKPFVRHR